MAQIAHHISIGRDLWGYKVHQGMVFHLALEDDKSHLQHRISRVFEVEGTSFLNFATNAKIIGGGLDGQSGKSAREHSDTRKPMGHTKIVTTSEWYLVSINSNDLVSWGEFN